MFLRTVIYSFLIAMISFQSVAGQLPDLGESIESSFTPIQERKLGRKFIRAVKQSVPLVQDSIVNDYIRKLGNRLVAYSDRPSKDYHFFVVDDPAINAFSGPDGYIGVNSGLILKAQNESELASVLAHEIAHVSQQHIARLIVDQKNSRLSTIATILAAIALGTQSPDAAFGIMTASMAGRYQHILNFSREKEIEADRIGMQILTKAGFDAQSMPMFFKRLAKVHQLNESGMPQILRTHPLTVVRLADAYNRSDRYRPHAEKYKMAFNLVQARLIVGLAHDINALIRQYRKRLTQKDLNLTQDQYAYALTLLEAGHFSQAKEQIDALVKKFPKQIEFNITAANIEEQLHHHQTALNILSSLYQIHPNDYPLMMEYAGFLVRSQKFREATKVIKSHYKSYQNDENFLRILSEGEGRSGNLVEAYQIRARICLLNGDKQAAREQLNMALTVAHDAAMKRKIRSKIVRLRKENFLE